MANHSVYSRFTFLLILMLSISDSTYLHPNGWFAPPYESAVQYAHTSHFSQGPIRNPVAAIDSFRTIPTASDWGEWETWGQQCYSAPAVGNSYGDTGGLTVFIRDGQRQVYQRTLHSAHGIRTNWQGLGGECETYPAAAFQQNGDIDVVCATLDGAISINLYIDNEWSGFKTLSNFISPYPPGLSSWFGRALFVYAVARWGAIHKLERRHGRYSTGWSAITGQEYAGAPVGATVLQPITMHSFGLATKNTGELMTTSFNKRNWVGRWTSLDFFTLCPPATSSRKYGFDIVAVAINGDVYVRSYDLVLGWGAWLDMGIKGTGTAAIASLDSGKMLVVVPTVGSDKWAYRIRGDAEGAWSKWETWEQEFLYHPVAVARDGKYFEVFGVDKSRSLLRKTFTV